MPAADSPAGSSQPASQASATAVAMVSTDSGKRLVPRNIPLEGPRPGWVRVEVAASGVCHADLEYAANPEASEENPVTPGHEIAGVIAELGDEVQGWSVGNRVAVGWFGGSCGHCAYCRVGDGVHCAELQVPGSSYPGGWAESVTVPASALARIPDGMDFFDAAPMGCAGVTTFNAIRKANLAPGATVAVLGIGGLNGWQPRPLRSPSAAGAARSGRGSCRKRAPGPSAFRRRCASCGAVRASRARRAVREREPLAPPP